MSWRHLRGPEMKTTVTNDGTARDAGDAVKFHTDGDVTALTAGDEVDGVLFDDAAVDEDNVRMDLLVPGSIWEVPVSSQTLYRGDEVAMAGSDNVDEATSGDDVVGIIVDENITSSDTTAKIEIRRRAIP